MMELKKDTLESEPSLDIDDIDFFYALEKQSSDKNIRDMLAAGIKLERIESIIGESNSLRDIAR